jgi:hypothetical protein
MLQSREYVSALPRLSRLNRINRAEDAMASIYKASYVSLHVRKSNRAALSLYRDSLGFTVQGIEKKYCVSTNPSDLASPLMCELQMPMEKTHMQCASR